MDFFEAQEQAVVRSRNLIVLFLAAVLSMIAVVYVTVLLGMGIGFGGVPGGWLNPPLLAGVAGGMVLLIGTGAAIRTAQLRKGGAVVAHLLGGSRVRPDTSNPAERRLLNVVEEMSIASGVPVPAVFVMENETGINAFAAGHTIHDAAVAVTRGTLESLNRDELQGVVAHEFSHILNGDMRLNVRLMGLLYGILLLTIVGRIVVRSPGGRRGKSGSAQIVILGLVLIVLGYLGVFFGRLIQAAVSRQREFLADASAVQFTRARDGIAGALKKIGGWRGSRIQDAHAAEVGHFLFAQGIGRAMAGALATHPPLEERIRRIDPTWDGVFVDLVVGSPEGGRGRVAAPAAPARTVGTLAAAMAPGARPTLPEVVASVGTIGSAALSYARGLVDRLPSAVVEAARTPAGAGDLVCALLLSTDPEVRHRQLQVVTSTRTGPGAERALAMWEAIYDLGAEARLPLLDLALPVLREVSVAEAAALQVTVPRLIRVDGRVLPFEFALFHILRRNLPGRSPEGGRGRGHLKLAQLRREARIVLSVVARAGTLPQDGPDAEMELGLEQVDAALERLALAAPMARKEILEAALASALGDGAFRPAEVEVVRAIAEALELPLPPVLVGTAA